MLSLAALACILDEAARTAVAIPRLAECRPAKTTSAAPRRISLGLHPDQVATVLQDA